MTPDQMNRLMAWVEAKVRDMHDRHADTGTAIAETAACKEMYEAFNLAYCPRTGLAIEKVETVEPVRHWRHVPHPKKAFGYAVQSSKGDYWVDGNGDVRFYASAKTARACARALDGV